MKGVTYDQYINVRNLIWELKKALKELYLPTKYYYVDGVSVSLMLNAFRENLLEVTEGHLLETISSHTGVGYIDDELSKYIDLRFEEVNLDLLYGKLLPLLISCGANVECEQMYDGLFLRTYEPEQYYKKFNEKLKEEDIFEK